MRAAETTLAKVCESVRYGYTASASDEEVGPRFVRITDIVPESINWSSVPFCSIDDEDRERFALQPNDIVVARTGATVGYAKLIREEVNAVFASYLVRFRVDEEKAYPRYVGHLVESSTYKSFVQSQVGGAAQPNANAQVLGTFKFSLPPRREQEKIADVLTAYDELMENNRRRMGLLEEAARLLYREWFVRLCFPGHEHARITNGIPEGWERVPFEDALILQRGFDLPEREWQEGDFPICGSSGIIGHHKESKVRGPGVFMGRSGSLGVVNYVEDDYWPHNTALWVREFKKVTPLFALFLLREMNLEQYNGGVSVPTLDRKAVHRVPVLIPQRKFITLFDDLLTPMFAQLRNLRQQNQKLRAARDLLLPRLMNGEITV